MDNLINKTFKDFENTPDMGPYERAAEWAAGCLSWLLRAARVRGRAKIPHKLVKLGENFSAN